MASGPITLWPVEGGKVDAVTDFLYLGSKITADGDGTHEIKRHLLLGSKAVTNLDSVLKSRDITLLTKVYLVKAMVFPVVRYGCQSWTIKKAECRRIGEGNGNPHQHSCLKNPRDRAWWAAVYGVAQSWTQLKRLNSSSSSRQGYGFSCGHVWM